MIVEDSVRGTVPMSRPTLASVVTINPDITFRELDGEIVILNLETGVYFGLDEVGARTWRLIEDHGSLGTVLARLRAEYDAAPAVLERDLLELVDQLCAKGLTRVAAKSA
jgi:Coenzyme PQQ synthesis protein D (PqqD)